MGVLRPTGVAAETAAGWGARKGEVLAPPSSPSPPPAWKSKRSASVGVAPAGAPPLKKGEREDDDGDFLAERHDLAGGSLPALQLPGSRGGWPSGRSPAGEAGDGREVGGGAAGGRGP